MIYLRELTREDLKVLYKWHNNAEIMKTVGNTFRYVNKETEEEWFDTYQKNRKTQVRCGICLQPDGKLIGQVGLIDMDYLNQVATFYIMIGETKEQGKGYGLLATKYMLQHGFMNLNLHRITLQVVADNTRALHLYEKCGFKKEGILREALFKEGLFKDCVTMGILREEFKM